MSKDRSLYPFQLQLRFVIASPGGNYFMTVLSSCLLLSLVAPPLSLCSPFVASLDSASFLCTFNVSNGLFQATHAADLGLATQING